MVKFFNHGTYKVFIVGDMAVIKPSHSYAPPTTETNELFDSLNNCFIIEHGYHGRRNAKKYWTMSSTAPSVEYEKFIEEWDKYKLKRKLKSVFKEEYTGLIR